MNLISIMYEIDYDNTHDEYSYDYISEPIPRIQERSSLCGQLLTDINKSFTTWVQAQEQSLCRGGCHVSWY